jgi:assimilatory nitrate reductase catalytic subunit
MADARRRGEGKRGCTKTASSPPPTAGALRRRAVQALAEPRDARYPFSLNTGRLRDQWHGMSRTGTLGRLFGHVPEPAVEMHPQDMARAGPQGRRPGARDLAARLDRACRRRPSDRTVATAQAFIAMHWGQEYLSGVEHGGELAGLQGVNARCHHARGAYCPASKQPEAEARRLRAGR